MYYFHCRVWISIPVCENQHTLSTFDKSWDYTHTKIYSTVIFNQPFLMMSFVSKKWNKVVSSKYVSLGHVFVDDCSHAIYSDPPRHKLGCYEKQQTRKFLLLTRERNQYTWSMPDQGKIQCSSRGQVICGVLFDKLNWELVTRSHEKYTLQYSTKNHDQTHYAIM